MLERIKNEPVLVVAFVQAVLFALVAFGLDLTKEQSTAILGVTGAALAFVARGRVTPNDKVHSTTEQFYGKG